MNLVIVESPTKAKTLAKILGKEYKIDASMGHIRDLPKKGLGVDIEHDFAPQYEIPAKAKKTVTQLKKGLKDAQTVLLATDPDREGEAIAWHLQHILQTAKEGKAQKYARVVFHELTKEAVLDAFSHPHALNENLVDSQQARRILDRLVGYKLSPLLWKKVRYGLSAGRVQSVAVRLIVERERERQAFVADEYWSLFANFGEFYAEHIKHKGKKIKLTTEAQATKAETDLSTDTFWVADVKKANRVKKAYGPLKTSTLQQTMANTLGFSASRTMKAAQKLFEEGLITYHRTDSLNLSPQFIQQTREYIAENFGKNYVPSSVPFYKTTSKNAQEAHEAIRPTSLTVEVTSPQVKKLGSDAEKVYLTILKRTLESQMVPAVYDQTTITVASEKKYELKATGSVITFDGWLAVGKKLKLKTDDEELVRLPDLSTNKTLQLIGVQKSQHFTQPPARYSDASLIKRLEELEIGRPSTYAPTIYTIQQRGYVQKEGRYFIPTDVAYVVTDLLVEHFENIVGYEFTAQMEDQLDEIAAGEKKWVPVLREFYEPFSLIVDEKDKVLSKRDVTNLGETDEKCPECGNPLLIKLGKYGKFLSCSGYPDCKYAKPMAQDVITDENGEAVVDFGKCTVCEDGVFVLKQGRFGKFLACSNYPKCKTTQSFLEKIGVSCPTCAEGEVVVKKAKGRTFYGCSRYPECKYSSWKKPTRGLKS